MYHVQVFQDESHFQYKFFNSENATVVRQSFKEKKILTLGSAFMAQVDELSTSEARVAFKHSLVFAAAAIVAHKHHRPLGHGVKCNEYRLKF